MVNSISICFDIFYEKLVYSGFPPARSKTKIVSWRILLAFGVNGSQRRNPLKRIFLSENVIFWGFRLSLGHFGQQALESPVSDPKWCINIFSTSLHCGLIDIWRLPMVQLLFSVGILEAVKWPLSQADYNGPKQQCQMSSIMLQSILFWQNLQLRCRENKSI